MPKKVAQGRAISYQRVSTQGQATEEKSSFERQQDAFDAWCAAHPDHPPLETYRIARSGAETGRFQWLMDGVKRGDFMPGDVLVVESINRFGREAMADTLENLFEIWKTGELQSDWPQPDKAWGHVDRGPLLHIVKVRIARAKAAASQSKRPKSLSQQQIQQQQ